MDDTKKALTPPEVVEHYPALTKSTNVLANWRHQKRGPRFYRISNKRIVYRPEDIERYLFRNPVLTIDSVS